MDPLIPCSSDSDNDCEDVFEHNGEKQVSPGISSTRQTYTREELVEISELPLSKKRPNNLSTNFQNDDGLWDPELWHRSADHRPSTEYDIDSYVPHRRFFDPSKERLKEESRDGIVLGPQRKSFMTGCHVDTGSSGQTQRGRESSESESRERESHDRERDHRDQREVNQRRIGSGRLTIDRDRYDRRDDTSRYDDRRHDDRQGRDDWRRDRGRDNCHRREEWTDYNGHSRHERMRKRSNNRMSESEPEWFTAGPNSQADTIELRGFNEPCSKEDNLVKAQSEVQPPPAVREPLAPSPKSDSCVTPSRVAPSPGADFDINELFNMDISGIRGGTSPTDGQTVNSESRFSQWFSNQASETASGQPSSHVNMDYDPIENLLANQPRRSLSTMDESVNRSDFMFLNQQGDSLQMQHVHPMGLIVGHPPTRMPREIIDPAHLEGHVQVNLKAMLLANSNQVPENRLSMEVPPNRFRTVSELEASLPDSVNYAPSSRHRLTQELPAQTGDMSAFNKLVGMMQISGSLPDSKRDSPNMDLLMAKFEQQQKQQLQQQLQAKLLQHQETMARQNPTIVTEPASPVPPMIGIPPNQTTPRMNSPNAIIQQQHMISQAGTPRAPSPVMFGQQPPLHLNAPSPVHPGSHGGSQQNLSVNSLQVNSGQHSPVMGRVPSPQELVYHTQAIMQNALIKKQLEDQKERFIKKQQRDRSPIDMAHVVVPQAVMAQAGVPFPGALSMAPSLTIQATQPVPPTGPKTTTAFTPTSVIKKMAVERSNSKEKLRNEQTAELEDGAEVMDPSRVLTVPPMPQSAEMKIRRALVGSGQMRSAQQAMQNQQEAANRNSSAKHMYQSPAGLTPMPTAIPRLNGPIDKSPAKSPMSFNLPPPMNMVGHPRNLPPGNPMLHLQALHQQSNTARVPPMNHLAMNQMNLNLQHQMGGPMDPRQVRGYYSPIAGGPRMGAMAGFRAVSPQPLMSPRSPIPGDNDLAKWFGMDMLKQQLPSMPPLPAQGQRVLTVDELERRQQVVS